MQSSLPPSRTNALRPALLVVLGLAVLGTAAGLILYNRGATPPASTVPSQAPAQSASTSQPTTPAQPATPAAPPAVKPSFDIVRINPNGDVVMAGRAAPGAKVTILEDGKPIGQAQADQNGDWVFVPSAPLSPGPRTLTLAEQTPSGEAATSDRSVVLVVPEATAAAQATPPLAVLTGPHAPPTVLTGPPGSEAAAGMQLGLNAAEYDEHGNLRVGGTAPPGATVRAYLDDKPIGQAVAGQDGKWGISSTEPIGPGEHHLRVDQLAANDTVAARVEHAFTREQLELAAGKIEIRRGQNLWTIARHTYGHGIAYLVIFRANRQAIRDPNLIYPGQVFTLPPAKAGPAIPASSSTSK